MMKGRSRRHSTVGALRRVSPLGLRRRRISGFRGRRNGLRVRIVGCGIGPWWLRPHRQGQNRTRRKGISLRHLRRRSGSPCRIRMTSIERGILIRAKRAARDRHWRKLVIGGARTGKSTLIVPGVNRLLLSSASTNDEPDQKSQKNDACDTSDDDPGKHSSAWPEVEISARCRSASA
jgi:hypothetical protein